MIFTQPHTEISKANVQCLEYFVQLVVSVASDDDGETVGDLVCIAVSQSVLLSGGGRWVGGRL